MATDKQIFNIEMFDCGSTMVDKKKASINRVLRFLRGYFSQFRCENVTGIACAGCERINWVHDEARGLELECFVGFGFPDRDSFEMILRESANPQRSVCIASSTNPAMADQLGLDQVIPCYLLLNDLVNALFEDHPPDEALRESLKKIYALAASNEHER